MSENEKHNIIIGLCVKNNYKGLPKVFFNLSKLKILFNKFLIVVYYDTSSDNSLNLLLKLKEEYNLDTIILNKEGRSTITSGQRTVRIAHARNNILKFIYEKGDEYNLFSMMDSNDYSCQGEINIDVIEKYLYNDKYKNKWNALTFARLPYYDLWAFSNDIFQLGCWSYITKGRDKVTEYQRDLYNYIDNYVFTPKNKEKLVEVDSAFCGFGLYKKEYFKNCIYNGLFTTKFFDKKMLDENLRKYKIELFEVINVECEHRPFHMMAKKLNNAKIMVACEQAFTIV